jgi:hypothetical protein|nr:MAG TPA: hypothetical protein [Caudoviricetes sp.]
MNVNEILELGKLGFSKNEIVGIMNAQYMSGMGQLTPGQVTPGQLTPGQVTPGQVTPGQVTPGQVTPGQVTPGQDATSAALMTAINTLTATLQAGNLSASGKAGSAPRTSDNVAEDLMKLMN